MGILGGGNPGNYRKLRDMYRLPIRRRVVAEVRVCRFTWMMIAKSFAPRGEILFYGRIRWPLLMFKNRATDLSVGHCCIVLAAHLKVIAMSGYGSAVKEKKCTVKLEKDSTDGCFRFPFCPETRVDVKESVRGQSIFIIQTIPR